MCDGPSYSSKISYLDTLRSDLLSCRYREIHEISPPHLTHPGWHLLNTHAHAHAHAQGHTLFKTDAIHWSGGQPIIAPREHGGAAPCSRAPRPWRGGGLPPLQLSVHRSLSSESGNRTADLPGIGRATEPGRPR